MCVSLLVGLLAYWNEANIGILSGSGWDIFLIFFGGFPGLNLQLIKKIWVSCMSVSLLVGLLPSWY